MTRARDLADGADKDITGTLTLDDVVLSNDMSVADNGKVQFGAGNDLQIYHDGSNSYVEDAGTGDLVIKGANVQIKDTDGDTMAFFQENDTAKLMFNGGTKIETTSTGVDVTGTVTADGLTVETASGDATGEIIAGGGTSILNLGDASDRDAGAIKYANASDSLQFFAAGSERVRVDSSGNVGIGKTPSNKPLEIYNSSNPAIRIQNSTTGTTNSDGFLLEQNGSNTLLVNYESGHQAFYTNATERMRIDSSGNVGIGQSSPSIRLEVVGSSDGTIAAFGNGQDNAYLLLRAASNFGSDNSIDDKWSLRWRGRPNAGGHSLAFYDEENSAERMRISSGGNLMLNTTSTSPNPGMSLAPSGGITLGNNNGTSGFYFLYMTRNTNLIGSITQSGTNGVAFNTSSDHRLKENVTDMTGAITRVKALAPKRFNFIADPDDTTVDGFLAHEAQAVVPEAITGTHNEVDDDGNAVMQGIDQSKLVPLLTAALQEAIAKIETLETKVAALEAE